MEEAQLAPLVVAAQGGDDAAWAELFRRFLPMVERVAFRMLLVDADSEELVQDTFVQAMERVGRLRDPHAFPGWLKSMVVRLGLRRLRTRRLRQLIGLGGDAGAEEAIERVASSSDPESSAALRQWARWVATLGPQERVCSVLRHVEGMTVDEIADVLGMSAPTVKRRLRASEEAFARWKGGAHAR